MLLVGRVGVSVARVQFRDHVDQSHVHEDASRAHEDPGSQVFQVAQQDADHHPDEGQDRAENQDTIGYSHREHETRPDPSQAMWPRGMATGKPSFTNMTLRAEIGLDWVDEYKEAPSSRNP